MDSTYDEDDEADASCEADDDSARFVIDVDERSSVSRGSGEVRFTHELSVSLSDETQARIQEMA